MRSKRPALLTALVLVATAGILLALASRGASPGVSSTAQRSGVALNGSNAVCSPSPCRRGAYVKHRLVVDDGAGRLVRRTYAVYRPAGLRNSPTNLAPLVVAINDDGWWNDPRPLPVSQRFVVVVIPNNVHCRGTNCQYAPRAVSPNPRTIGPHDCGPRLSSPCDDVPWIGAVLDRVVCTGAPPCENIDPAKVFVAGSSKGGTMAMGLMCDPRTSRRFSGYASMSIPMISPSTANDPRALPRCRAVLGPHPNRDLSVQWLFGDRDPVWQGRCRAHFDCLEGGFTDIRNRWDFGMAQLAGDKAFGQRVFGAALGCSPTPVVTQDSPHLIRKVYGGCSAPGRATSYFKVVGGGHGEPGMRGIDGFDANLEAWNFWIAHPGRGWRSGGGSSLPVAIITKPRQRQVIRLRSKGTKRHGVLRFAGTARAAVGVRSVKLTLRRLGGGRPLRFTAKLAKNGRWTCTVPPTLRLAPGRYVLRAIATDGAGVSGNGAARKRRAVTFSLK